MLRQPTGLQVLVVLCGVLLALLNNASFIQHAKTLGPRDRAHATRQAVLHLPVFRVRRLPEPGHNPVQGVVQDRRGGRGAHGRPREVEVPRVPRVYRGAR